MANDRLQAIRDAAPAILPSLLKTDFGDLKGEVARLQDAGARVLHLDVMDGHFVPNLTYGMPIIEGLRRHTDLPLDVHLMISEPLKYAKAMVEAGADSLTFHVEAVRDPLETAQQIRDLGCGVGVTLNPETPLASLRECLPEVDMVLVMSVEAGFGGQQFDPVALEKLQTLREARPDLLLEIDGGIDTDTIGPARQAGCDLFVVGSAIFNKDDYRVAMDELGTAMHNQARRPIVIVKAPKIAQVLLVRPGATLFDDQGRIKGSLDVPMSQRGRQQAMSLSEDLSRFDLKAIYTAPCESARETAERIASSQADGRDVLVKVVDAFRNIDHGLWHGKRIDELKRNHPRLYRKGQESPDDICPPNGESIRDARARVIKAVRKVLRKSSGHVVAIVIPDPMAWVVQSLLSGDELSNLWNAETDSGSWELVETLSR